MTPLHSPTLSPRSGHDASRSSRSPLLLCFECYPMATAVLRKTLFWTPLLRSRFVSPSSSRIWTLLQLKIGSASSRCSLRQILPGYLSGRVPDGVTPAVPSVIVPSPPSVVPILQVRRLPTSCCQPAQLKLLQSRQQTVIFPSYRSISSPD